MTLKMTTAQVVETSVTVTNSSFQNYTHPDDHTTRTSNMNVNELGVSERVNVPIHTSWLQESLGEYE